MNLPPTGTQLIGQRRKPRPHIVRGSVVADLGFPLGRAVDVDGKRFATLSAAARSVVGYETNGWVWWKNGDGTPLARTQR